MLAGEGRAHAQAPWKAVLTGPTRTAALAVAHDVVARCSDPGRVAAALEAARRQTDFPRSIYWEPFGIAQGDAGLALMAGYADAAFPAEGWEVCAHEKLVAAALAAQQAPYASTGLFSGLAGLLFAATLLSRGGARYRRALTSIEASLHPAAIARAERLRGLPAGMSVGEFDGISGLAGTGAALLARGRHGQNALMTILRALAELAGGGGAVPRWYTPAGEMADEAMASMYPDGNLNCGLAHGIPGPLAMMSLARLEGLEVPGMGEAIAKVAEWLVDHRVDDAWGVNWPTAVAVGSGAPDAPSRAAWCYGTPGIARALWLAGQALDDDALRQTGIEGMEAVYRRPVAARGIDSPTFCHGVAGLLQVTLRFAHDTDLSVFEDAARELTGQLLDGYDGSRLLGYASLEPGDNVVDQPGLLDGAPGVALVLIAAATDAEPAWDRAFLLS